jgi:hypothetical protein
MDRVHDGAGGAPAAHAVVEEGGDVVDDGVAAAALEVPAARCMTLMPSASWGGSCARVPLMCSARLVVGVADLHGHGHGSFRTFRWLPRRGPDR